MSVVLDFRKVTQYGTVSSEMSPTRVLEGEQRENSWLVPGCWRRPSRVELSKLFSER